MVKKIILAILVLMLAASVSLVSAQKGIHEPGTGLANPELKEAAQGTGQGLQNATDTNASKSTPGIHEPGTGIADPELKEAAKAAGQGNQARSGQAAEPSESAPQTQPGFESLFAIAGLIAVASALKLRN
ncbi:MAG TPA: PGF-CTERM sorting domain-containing protein [Methanothrix sp.]|jgi:hypothetical protein|nr:PGF-CTERM sorting domain-containing protein [Methanothrix sp.]HPM25994.1 PGF-CTERM sorting domain-containing protein [Methanothrix sp.]